jgi:hypothetical protein
LQKVGGVFILLLAFRVGTPALGLALDQLLGSPRLGDLGHRLGDWCRGADDLGCQPLCFLLVAVAGLVHDKFGLER